MKYIVVLLILAAPCGAQELRLTLKSAEEAALAADGQYKAARFTAQAAAAAASAAGSLLYPRLALEGSLRYSQVVPEIKLPAAMGGAKPMGDNWSYSAGPSAYWTLDGGALRRGRDASRRMADARSQEAESARRQAILKARNAYFRVQLALEKSYLIGEGLVLARSQLGDMEVGVRAGTRSRLDALRARQEETARRRDLLRARVELAAALRDYAFVTGAELPVHGLPLDARLFPSDLGISTGPAVCAENYETLQAALQPAASRGLDKALPSVLALSDLAASYSAAAAAQKGERLPRLTLGARSSVDYPNGPNLYSFIQNSASLSLSMPLFESGRIADRERESRLSAEAASARGEEAARAAARDYDGVLQDYAALAEEQGLDLDAVDDAAEAARLTYEAYKAGAAAWLEVESANLKALQAKTTLASANTELLMKLAVLDSLSGR